MKPIREPPFPQIPTSQADSVAPNESSSTTERPPPDPTPLSESSRPEQTDFLKRGARHEAAHVVVGHAIGEEVEWVNVIGMPGQKHAKTHFKYSREARLIIDEQWDGLRNRDVMTKKILDLATCFVAGHIIEYEKYKQLRPVSVQIQESRREVWATMRQGDMDYHVVAWLLSLIDRRDVRLVQQLEQSAIRLVNARRPLLDAIERRLLEKGHIEPEELRQLLERGGATQT